MSLQQITLPYGQDQLTFAIPAAADILSPREPPHQVSRTAFRSGLADLMAGADLTGRIALVVADKTRLCGYPLVLPWLVEVLTELGVSRHQLLFFIAYGTHARQSETESLTAYGPIYRKYTFIHHDSADSSLFVELGSTSRGTPVRIRGDLLSASTIITIGAISHHYFAGFGGGRKLLFPGLAEQEAIFCNHRLFLDADRRTLSPGCRSGRVEGNPIAEDLSEAYALLPAHLSIHGLLDSHGQVAAYRFGRTYGDFLDVCREHDHYFQAETDRQYDLVLASAGGYPKDINLIQAHKAIDNAAAFVRDGKTLILLAQCRDGIGSSTFLPSFERGSKTAAFDSLLHAYSGNGGTALAMMAKSERIRLCMMTDLDPLPCQRIGIKAVDQQTVAIQLHQCPGDLAVIANGSMLIRRQNEHA